MGVVPKKTNQKRKNAKPIIDEYEYELEPEYVETEISLPIKKKKGRKPSGKLFSEMEEKTTKTKASISSECIFAHLTISDKDIEKITGKKVEQKPKVKISEKQISLSLETDVELEIALIKANKEIKNLKDQYKDLEEKFNRFKYLETVVSDNGVIDKEYCVPKDVVIDKNGKWKKQTNIWCTHCVHPFTTVPIGLPEAFCKKTQKFIVRDCFCSFNCAHAFNIDLNDHKVWERLGLLNRMKNIVFEGSEIANKPIIRAGPRKTLKVFGGTKTIEEFRNNRISIPKNYINLLPPSIPMFSVIEEIPAFFTANKSTNMYDKLRSRNVNPLALKNKIVNETKTPFIAGNIQQLFN